VVERDGAQPGLGALDPRQPSPVAEGLDERLLDRILGVGLAAVQRQHLHDEPAVRRVVQLVDQVWCGYRSSPGESILRHDDTRGRPLVPDRAGSGHSAPDR